MDTTKEVEAAMRYVKQLGIILLATLLGELLSSFIPLPIPAGIYGLVLMFSALKLGVLRLSQVEETADFLIEILILTFIPASVKLMDLWGAAAAILTPALLAGTLGTLLVMAAAGWTTQRVIRLERRRYHE